MDILSDIVQQSILKFLWTGSIAGILLGAGMCFRPSIVERANLYFSRWIGTGTISKRLDKPRWIERYFYQHHLLFGACIVIGAMIVLYIFLFKYNVRTIASLIQPGYWWLSDALIGMLLVGSVLASLIGAVVLFKPSLLRDMETSVNYWIATDRLLVFFESKHDYVEKFMLHNNRVVGVSLLIGSAYVLAILGYLLFQGTGKL